MNHFSHLAKRPPMGWNSWDCFSVTVTEEEVRANADFIAKHLKQYGWEYVVVDLCWFAPGASHHNYKDHHIAQLIDEYGRLIPDPEKFPSSANGKGFKPLADYIHSLGLKFGIHIMRGIPFQAVEEKTRVKGTLSTADQISYDRESCPWYNSLHTLNFAHKDAISYYHSIFELYASWDVDYIKADDLNAWHEVNNSDGSPTGTGSPYRIDDIEAIRKSIDKCGRPMVLSISPGGPETTIINHLRQNTNLWRISADFWDEWGSLKKQMERCAIWAPFVTEGHWPDADMLPLGYMPRGESGGQQRFTNFTREEQRTVVTLWCMFRSPLMFGGHLPESDDFVLSLITHPEVIEINQHGKNGREIYCDDIQVIWQTEAPDPNTHYFAVFNTGESRLETQLKPETYLGEKSSYHVRNIWNKEDLGDLDHIPLNISPHDVSLFKVKIN